jgi:hypothetical protein
MIAYGISNNGAPRISTLDRRGSAQSNRLTNRDVGFGSVSSACTSHGHVTQSIRM